MNGFRSNVRKLFVVCIVSYFSVIQIAHAESHIELSKCHIFYSGMQDAEKYQKTFCKIDGTEFCNWIVDEFVDAGGSCVDGEFLRQDSWSVRITRPEMSEYTEFAIVIVGPSSSLIGANHRAFEIIRGRLFLTLGYSMKTIPIVALNDARLNFHGFQNARNAENDNSKPLRNDAAISDFQQRFSKMVRNNFIKRWSN